MMGSQQVYSISHHSENPELAFRFIRFVLTDPSAMQRLIASGVIVPATRGGLESWRLQLGERASLYDAWLRYVANGRSFPYDRHWPDVEAVLQREIGRIFRGEASVKEALDRASREIEAVLDFRIADETTRHRRILNHWGYGRRNPVPAGENKSVEQVFVAKSTGKTGG